MCKNSALKYLKNNYTFVITFVELSSYIATQRNPRLFKVTVYLVKLLQI